MKNSQSALLGLILLALSACGSDPRKEIPVTGQFGNTFSVQKGNTVSEVLAGLDTLDQFESTLEGTITSVCKGEGCWLMMKDESRKELLVTVKDKAFLLPYHIEGKRAIAHGQAINDHTDSTISVIADGIRIE